MKRKLLFGGVLMGLLMAGGWAAPAGAQTARTPSLGEYARELKAQRAEGPQKPVKVFTNDNIPHSGGLTTTTIGESKPANSAQTGKKPSAEAKSSGAHDETYYRDKLNDLQDKKEMHERELAVLEQKSGVSQTQYYSDPNKTLQQESTPAFYSDTTKLRKEVDAKKQQIADDQKAIDDLQQQCIREGCPPGWLR
jgi:hypothetical protein